MKPYEFPTEGTTVMAGKGGKFNDRSQSACSVIGFQFLAAKTLFCLSAYSGFFFFYHLVLAVQINNVCFTGFLRPADSEGIPEGIQNSCADEDN